MNQVHSRNGFYDCTSVKSAMGNKYLKSSECARGLQFNESGFPSYKDFYN